MSSTVCREIIESIKDISNPTKEDVNQAKLRIAAKHALKRVPPNSELIRHLKSDEPDGPIPSRRSFSTAFQLWAAPTVL